MNLQTKLTELYEEYGQFLAPYLWASESDRWAELVLCLLHQCFAGEPGTNIRQAVTLLQDLNLLEVDRLVGLHDPTSQSTITFVYILKQQGFSDAAIRRATKVLSDAATIVKTRYDSKIQRYLRRHAQIMRDELVSVFGDLNLTKEQLQYAIVHWLQNVLSLPLSLESPAVIEFCEKNGVSIDDLMHACDSLDINAAIVDDLLELNKAMDTGISEEPSAEDDE